ncbi:MAG: energy transducer TonB [Acidobacteriota bacterium]|nr:energy transducer TonB [Acidobacteriota bacterium]
MLKKYGLKSPKAFTWIGGYREKATVELFIKPSACSQSPNSISDYSIEEVEFSEAPANKITQKSINDLMSSVVNSVEPKCPPAARAVRACSGEVEVFTIVDEKGNVIVTGSVSGHPLLRMAAANTVKQWKFKPTLMNNKPINVSGRVIVKFTDPDAEEIAY